MKLQTIISNVTVPIHRKGLIKKTHSVIISVSSPIKVYVGLSSLQQFNGGQGHFLWIILKNRILPQWLESCCLRVVSCTRVEPRICGTSAIHSFHKFCWFKQACSHSYSTLSNRILANKFHYFTLILPLKVSIQPQHVPSVDLTFPPQPTLIFV